MGCSLKGIDSPEMPDLVVGALPCYMFPHACSPLGSLTLSMPHIRALKGDCRLRRTAAYLQQAAPAVFVC